MARKEDKSPPHSLESTGSNRLSNESLVKIFPSPGSTLMISSCLKRRPPFLGFVEQHVLLRRRLLEFVLMNARHSSVPLVASAQFALIFARRFLGLVFTRCLSAHSICSGILTATGGLGAA